MHKKASRAFSTNSRGLGPRARADFRTPFVSRISKYSCRYQPGSPHCPYPAQKFRSLDIYFTRVFMIIYFLYLCHHHLLFGYFGFFFPPPNPSSPPHKSASPAVIQTTPGAPPLHPEDPSCWQLEAQNTAFRERDTDLFDKRTYYINQ